MRGVMRSGVQESSPKERGVFHLLAGLIVYYDQAKKPSLHLAAYPLIADFIQN